jgi:type VI secretion system protein VasG
MQVDMKALIGRLNHPCKKALESAAALCVQNTHFNVEVEHFLAKLLDTPESDIQLILRHFEVDSGQLKKQLIATLDQLPRGCVAHPVLSPHILTLLEQSWLVTSLSVGQTKIRSGAILLALIDTESLRGAILEKSPLLLRIPRHILKENLSQILHHSPEDQHSRPSSSTPESLKIPSSTQPTKQSLTTLYTLDLTARAQLGKLDPVVGRDKEINQLLDILLRRRQNNPILVGDAGVGKTAIVEGLAQKLALAEVPLSLKQAQLLTLDLTLLQAGASARGEFEERLSHLLEEIKTGPHPIILFVDEAHTLIGAGGNSGIGDAANILKPALARGELRLIAATTWPEYKRYIEKDAALTRRFELVKVNEPSTDDAINMVRLVSNKLTQHHQVIILQEAIEASVKLSQRFLPERRLPDKAISLLDTACARVALSRRHTPALIQELENQLHLLQIQQDMIQQEQRTTRHQSKELQNIQQQIDQVQQQLAHHQDLWQQAKILLEQIEQLYQQFSNHDDNAKDLLSQLEQLETSLHHFIDPLGLHLQVDRKAIAKVLHSWTGIPLQTMILLNQNTNAHTIHQELGRRVIGQRQALKQIAERVSCYFSQLTDPSKPMGIFALIGPSGVGKTETAHALSAILTGSENALIRINMTEFQEAHSVATLRGSPPGYVGYGKGGILTEAVRRNPYSVILLDEIEKAHPDVMELFYQVFDKGILDDAEGLEIDFRNTLIILTSNLGSEAILEAWESSHRQVDALLLKQLHDLTLPALERHLRPSLVARLQIIPYHPLGIEELTEITRLKLNAVDQRLRQYHAQELAILDQDITLIVEQCQRAQHGARSIDDIINRTVLPRLSERILIPPEATAPSTIELGQLLK